MGAHGGFGGVESSVPVGLLDGRDPPSPTRTITVGAVDAKLWRHLTDGQERVVFPKGTPTTAKTAVVANLPPRKRWNSGMPPWYNKPHRYLDRCGPLAHPTLKYLRLGVDPWAPDTWDALGVDTDCLCSTAAEVPLAGISRAVWGCLLYEVQQAGCCTEVKGEPPTFPTAKVADTKYHFYIVNAIDFTVPCHESPDGYVLQEALKAGGVQGVKTVVGRIDEGNNVLFIEVGIGDKERVLKVLVELDIPVEYYD